MSSFAKRMQGVATRLIGKFDERATKVQLIRESDGKYFDFTLGEYVFPQPDNLSIACVQTNQENKLFENSQVENGDILLILTSAIKPLMSDNILSDGKTYSIVDIKPVSYTGADLAISYGVHARG